MSPAAASASSAVRQGAYPRSRNATNATGSASSPSRSGAFRYGSSARSGYSRPSGTDTASHAAITDTTAMPAGDRSVRCTTTIRMTVNTAALSTGPFRTTATDTTSATPSTAPRNRRPGCIWK
ncbi:hypothetical protein [Actinomadura keratinilytica]|uniref:hypothetical protein n=1 Tax=Actinomadura keratinilytica TaxID=547461 RepID=UPI00361C389D